MCEKQILVGLRVETERELIRRPATVSLRQERTRVVM